MSLPAAFLRDAEQLIPADRRFDDPLSTLAFGTDASFYRLIPKLVIRVESEDEVVAHWRARSMCNRCCRVSTVRSLIWSSIT